jgi:predicted DCC family thiol-disulfide oxidoreductase YuxK
MISYESEEARQALKERYRPGRPDVAFLIDEEGRVLQGLDAFIALLPGLKGGQVLARLFQVPWVRPLGLVMYRWLAKYRYRLFGEVFDKAENRKQS